jgi:molecular chaperone GrpE
MSEKSKKKKAKAEPTPETEQTVPETEAVEEEVQPKAEEPKQEEKPAEAPKQEEKPAKEPKAKAEKEPDLKSQLAAEKDKYLRLLAEYDNFRRRSQKEKENIYTDVRGETLKKFLPVYDSLWRALTQTAEDDPARKGLEMIMTQYENALTQLGVSLIEAVGQPFDANFHNAVMHVEDESVGENIVVEEFEKGFKIGDKVLRYSVVKVAN